MKVLVTGGAGYIGSVVVKKLLDEGHFVVVVDNLSKGKKELVDSRAKLYDKDLTEDLSGVFSNKIDAVIHFAAYKAVEESMVNAVKYSDNIIGYLNLLKYCVRNNVKKFIFSSTAAVYEEMDGPLTESSPTNPANFYGFTKLEIEKTLSWYNKINDLSYISLRYFNVAGDYLSFIDPEAKNVFPILAETVIGKREKFIIYGDDYPTFDGTCIRDYIHIEDLVDAHILALKSSFDGILNLGSENGYSVKQLVDSFKEISGKDFTVEIGDRRVGDPATVIASCKKAKEVLNWQPKHPLKDMVQSTLLAYR